MTQFSEMKLTIIFEQFGVIINFSEEVMTRAECARVPAGKMWMNAREGH